jgi:hypothetical protein
VYTYDPGVLKGPTETELVRLFPAQVADAGQASGPGLVTGTEVDVCEETAGPEPVCFQLIEDMTGVTVSSVP